MNLIEFCIASDNLNRAIDYEEKYKDLQQRIDKAINLIKHNDIMHYSVFEKELLKILKGDKNV